MKKILILLFLLISTNSFAATILGNGNASSFSPTDISGLKAWWKADNGVYSDAGTTPAVDGDLVQQWNDSSSNARNASQGTSGSRPTYKTSIVNGKPVIRFDKTRQMTFTTETLPNFTAFVVYQVNTSITNDYQGTLNWTHSGEAGFFIGDPSFIAGFTAGYVPFTTSAEGQSKKTPNISPPTGWLLQTTTSTPIINLNAVLQSLLNGEAGWGRPATGLIGKGYSGTEGFLDGDIAEIIVYDSVLSDGNITNVETYLNTKYALY